jgi:glycosyltransferase involved in cell wall biosynthesis
MSGIAPVFVVGYPSSLGGADTELWHVLKLWRSHGLNVTLIPTWHAAPEWRARCDAIGVRTCEIEGPDDLSKVAGLPGSTVVSFCNGEFLAHAATLHELGCRLAWAGCMTWLFPAEEDYYAQFGPFEAYIFQSLFQRECLFGPLAEHGVTAQRCHLIRGALDADEFPFRPRLHAAGEEFVVGRISRPDPSKFHADLWRLFECIPYRPLKVRVLGWSAQVEAKLGAPPPWAEVLAPGDESVEQFLRSIHCLVQVNGGSRENWPRVGLEALASGTPLIVENAWGWREMVRHTVDGLTAAGIDEIPTLIGKLANDPPYRSTLARAGRKRLAELANPEDLWERWRALFLACQSPVQAKLSSKVSEPRTKLSASEAG